MTVRTFVRYWLTCGLCRHEYEVRVPAGMLLRPQCPECDNTTHQMLRTPKVSN